MKLSNKILLGFLGVIFLYLTAAFAEVRLRGTPNIINDKNSLAETVDISSVRYLVVNDVKKQIHVYGADRAAFEVRSFGGDFLSKVKYKVSGDTLTISGITSEATERVKISVFVPKTSLKGISVDGSVLIIQELEADLLNISQNAGTLWMSHCKFGKLELKAEAANVDISGSTLDTLSADITAAYVNIYSPVGLLQGTINRGSFLRVSDAREIQLKKDQSSRLNMLQ